MNFANFWCNVSAIKIGENVSSDTMKAIAAAVEKTLPMKKAKTQPTPEVTE